MSSGHYKRQPKRRTLEAYRVQCSLHFAVLEQRRMICGSTRTSLSHQGQVKGSFEVRLGVLDAFGRGRKRAQYVTRRDASDSRNATHTQLIAPYETTWKLPLFVGQIYMDMINQYSINFTMKQRVSSSKYVFV